MAAAQDRHVSEVRIHIRGSLLLHRPWPGTINPPGAGLSVSLNHQEQLWQGSRLGLLQEGRLQTCECKPPTALQRWVRGLGALAEWVRRFTPGEQTATDYPSLSPLPWAHCPSSPALGHFV